MRKQLLRLLRIAPLALMFASVAFAQTTGTIIGVVTDASTNKPVAGALIVATSPNLQGEQTAVTDNAGNFRISQLPPGTYKLAVQLEGFNPAERGDVTVRPDKTLRANLAVVPSSVQMEEQVVRTGVAPVVNVGTAETGTVVSKEFIASVPVARGFEGIAVVAPTARNDLYGVSFAGAQSPENQYIVDGLNTTDPQYGTRGPSGGGPPSLRSNFVQEVDVKTGNFSAEYGRATGGILNVILKGGSNEFHGSVFSSFTPSLWVEPNGATVGSSGEAIGYRTAPGEGTYGLDLGFEVGGPVLKDRLWFYGGFSPIIQRTYYERFLRKNVVVGRDGLTACPAGSSPNGDDQCIDDSTGAFLQNNIPGTTSTLNTEQTTYQWVGKLTYLLNADNTFTVSGWGAPRSRTGLGSGFFGGEMYNAPSHRLLDTDDNQTALLGRWTGKFFSRKLLPEVQVGWYTTKVSPKASVRGGVDQASAPVVEFIQTLPITTFESAPGCTDDIDCPVTNYQIGGRGGNFNAETNRYVGRASLSYLLSLAGLHNWKAGVDLERVEFTSGPKSYTGGFWYLYRNVSVPAANFSGPVFQAFRGFGSINAPANAAGVVGSNDVNTVATSVMKNTSQTDSLAYFLQDSWQVVPSVTLNAGIRLETQQMRNLDFTDSTGFKITDNWSPRLQAIWDFTGNGRGKLAGSWGRFYYAMPLDMGDRAFGSDQNVTFLLNAATCGLADPTGASSFNTASLGYQGQGGCQVIQRGGAGAFRQTSGAFTPADPDLKGSFVDQFGGQLEYEVLPDLSVALEYQGRRQGNVIEDLSPNDGAFYFIGNPGRDRTFTFQGEELSTKFVDSVEPLTGRTIRIEFPKPERSYDAMTLKATKNFSKSWLAQASYTYSYLRGNYPGPYRPEDGQLDPGITSEYDLASLMANKNGFLPGDQPHQIKLFGAYNFALSPKFNVTASGAYNGASGTPVNALGAHPDYGPGQAFIIPRGMGGRTPFQHTVDLGGMVEYVIRAPYAVNFRVDVFNVFNRKSVFEVDQDYTFDDVAPINGITCGSKNSAGKSNGVQALQSDCPDLAYLRTTDGRPVTVNPNWGKAARSATAFQTPLSLRLSLAFTF